MSLGYTIREERGAWEIVLTHVVKTCLTERDARFWVENWNEGRNPTPEEIAGHLSRDWPKAVEGEK
jgi:hypothetical protein